MTAKRRVEALEERIAPTNEKCYLVVWDDGNPLRCSKKCLELSRDMNGDLNECKTCPVKNRQHLLVRWVGPPTVQVENNGLTLTY